VQIGPLNCVINVSEKSRREKPVTTPEIPREDSSEVLRSGSCCRGCDLVPPWRLASYRIKSVILESPTRGTRSEGLTIGHALRRRPAV